MQSVKSQKWRFGVKARCIFLFPLFCCWLSFFPLNTQLYNPPPSEHSGEPYPVANFLLRLLPFINIFVSAFNQQVHTYLSWLSSEHLLHLLKQLGKQFKRKTNWHFGVNQAQCRNDHSAPLGITNHLKMCREFNLCFLTHLYASTVPTALRMCLTGTCRTYNTG